MSRKSNKAPGEPPEVELVRKPSWLIASQAERPLPIVFGRSTALCDAVQAVPDLPRSVFVALAKELQQVEEEIDEVEVERERAEDRLLGGSLFVVPLPIELLDALRIVSGEAH